MIALCCLVTACSTSHQSRAKRSRFQYEHPLARLPKSDVPLVVNDRVIAWIDYFQGPGRSHFERYLNRAGKYIPMMQEILLSEGMPLDLVYVALIESGFNPHARSRANAVGAWQFIRGTGRHYRLEISPWVDERRDPVRATAAAANYLRDLHREFGDWYLALASYNAGEGRVRQAIAQAGSRDFWDLTSPSHRALRPETRDYVPKFLAATIIAKAPEKFGFPPIAFTSYAFDTVQVETQTDFGVIARCAGTSTEEIQELNPHLVRQVTPAGRRNVEVRIPMGKKASFVLAFAQVPVRERVSLAALQPDRNVIRHRVRRGETLAKIADRYGVTVADLKRWDRLRRTAIHAGMRLRVHRSADGSFVAHEPAIAEANGEKLLHTLAAGETLGQVATRYRVKTVDLMRWNGIRNTRRVRAGTKLALYRVKPTAPERIVAEAPTASSATEAAPSESAPVQVAQATLPQPEMTHELKPGETLGHVADLYRVKTRDVMRWNSITNPRRVRAGTVLKIQKP